MNIKKGSIRLAIFLSLLSVAFAIMLGFAGEDEDVVCVFLFIFPVIVWICYWGFWFVYKGFKSIQCENCEKELGNLEVTYDFKSHKVCMTCYGKLNSDKKD